MIPQIIEDRTVIEDHIRDYLAKINYNSNTVIARHFAGERLNKVLETGTDRARNSVVWNHHYDYKGKKPSDASMITYAWTVDLTQKPFKTIRNVDAPTNFSLFFSITDGAVIYDPAKLERKSECEYHFLTSQLDAVLGIFITPQTSPPKNFLREKISSFKNYLINLSDYVKHNINQRRISKNTIYFSEDNINDFLP